MPADARASAGATARAPRDMQHFIARAREIARVAPTVAYYCRMRAVEVGMNLHPRPDDALRAVLDVLERTKRSTPLSGDVFMDFSTCRKFALEVYDRADRADRAGKRTKDTVEAFSAASTFLRALEHFEELPEERRVMRDEDCARRREFAEWRAFDLTQAMQLGRKPTELKTLSDPAPTPVVSTEPVAPPPPVRWSSAATTAPSSPPAPPAPPAPPPPPPPPPPPVEEEVRESPVDASTSSAGTVSEEKIVDSESEPEPPAPSAPPPPPPPETPSADAEEVSEKMEALDVSEKKMVDESASEEARSSVENETKEEE